MSTPFALSISPLRSLSSLASQRSTQIGAGVGLLAVILATVLAPNGSASGWDWVRLLLISALAAIGILLFASSRTEAESRNDQSQQLFLAGMAVAVAILLNLTFSLGTTILFSLGISLTTVVVMSGALRTSPWTATGTLIALVPFWVWSALDAWTWLLLVLIPLTVIGVIADGHVRSTSPDASATGAMSQRAHWLAGSLGVFAVAGIALVVALITDAANGVNALGVTGAVALTALAASTSRTDDEGANRAVTLIDGALLWVALCWVVSL